MAGPPKPAWAHAGTYVARRIERAKLIGSMGIVGT